MNFKALVSVDQSIPAVLTPKYVRYSIANPRNFRHKFTDIAAVCALNRTYLRTYLKVDPIRRD